MALVQGAAIDTFNGNISKSFTSNVTAGDIIVAASAAFQATVLSAPTTSGTAVLGSWTAFRGTNLSALSCLANIWVAKVTTGGTLTLTTVATGANSISLVIAEFDGTWGTTFIDGTLTSTGSGSSTAPAAASITPTAGDLMIGFQFNDGGSGMAQTPGTNYLDGTISTNHSLNTTVGGVDSSMEWWLDSAGAATTAPWTLGSSSSWGAIAGALKPSGGAASPNPPPIRLIQQAVQRAANW